METDQIVDTEPGSPTGRRERSYKCQRCLNHNRLVSRKGHQCPYKDCMCPGCNLNNLRSELMAVLRERGLSHSDVFVTKKMGRKQHCMLCSFHGEKIELRGHKRYCPWTKCECTLCTIGRHYRDTMAKQTKHRRSQRKPEMSRKAPDDKRSAADRLSKRVSVKQDWRRRVQATRDRNGETETERTDHSGDIDSDFQSRVDVASARSNPKSESSPVQVVPAVHNGPRTPDRDSVKLASTLQHPQRTLWSENITGSPPSVHGSNNGNPFLQPANLLNAVFQSQALPSQVPTMASAVASHLIAQQRQATDLALAFLLSRYGGVPNAFPLSPGFCLGCQRNTEVPVPAACLQGHTLLKVDQYLNALREYNPLLAAASQSTFPASLRSVDVRAPTSTFFQVI